MLLMQLMGCSGKLKATSIFLSWLLEHLPDFFIFGTALVLCEKVSRYIRLLGRCIPPSSGVLEWHRGKIEPALAHLHFSIAPSKLYYQIWGCALSFPKNVPSHASTPGKAQLINEVQQLLPHKKCQERKVMLAFCLHAVYKLQYQLWGYVLSFPSKYIIMLFTLSRLQLKNWKHPETDRIQKFDRTERCCWHLSPVDSQLHHQYWRPCNFLAN